MKFKLSLLKSVIACIIPLALFAVSGCQSTRAPGTSGNDADLKTAVDENARLLSELSRAREEDSRNMNELKTAMQENAEKSARTLEVCTAVSKKLEQENQSLRQEINTLSGEVRQNRSHAPRSGTGDTAKVSGDATRLDNGKMIFGNQEWVYIAEADASFAGRIDTGASVSSINATNIEKIERDGKVWYKFDIPLDDGSVIHLSAPRVRTAVIIQASSDTPEERPVVKLTVKIGSYTGVNEFSLKNRDKMQFPLLVGREFIQDIAVVDVTRENVQKKIDSGVSVEAYKDAGPKNRQKKSSGKDNKKPESAPEKQAQILAHPKDDTEDGDAPDSGSNKK